jgi:ATP-dependent Lhr-like helicase
LLTTPESLAVLLTQPLCHSLFAGLRWVVVDEVHAVAANKRGADLALSLERLEELAPEGFQRIGLSATVTPLSEAAQFLAGAGRPCRVVAVPDDSRVEVVVQPLADQAGFFAELIAAIEPHLHRHLATLIFANTRRLAERLAWSLRRAFPDWDADIAVHHSALAPARRADIEAAFKAGRLRAVVSSTSLELGIDIGAVDLVVLVHPPGDVVRFLQRLGRAGHEPGRVKRGLVLTATPAELLEAAVTGACGRSSQCEPLGVPEHPLDVLCQHLLGMAALETCFDDEVFQRVRRAYPYRQLPRADFDDCLLYLFGKDNRGETWLPARLRRDEGGFTLRDRSAARLLRRNLGTIVAEEQTPVLRRVPAGTDAEENYQPVGEITAAFAERLRPGDRFLLDGRCLECRTGHEGAVVVDEVVGRPIVPVWGGEGLPLSASLAERLFAVRVRAAELLREGHGRLAALLGQDYGLDAAASGILANYVLRQECVSEVPDQTFCLLEAVPADNHTTFYVHTPLNRLANDALARVVVRRLVRDHGRSAATFVADLGFAFTLSSRPHDVPELFRGLLGAEAFEEDLAASLGDSLALRETFRRVAQTGLMVLRNPLGKRRRVGGPAWADRQLFDQIRARDPAFVLLRQAHREVARDVCDLGAARAYAAALPVRAVRCRYLAQPSPFVENWARLQYGPAETVETPNDALRRLHAQLTGTGLRESAATVPAAGGSFINQNGDYCRDPDW